MTDRRRLLVPGADSLRLDYLPGRTHLCKGRAGGGPWRMPIHCVPYIGCVSRPRNRGPSTLPYELDRLEVCSYEYLRLAYRGEKDEAKSARICRCRRHVSAEGVACWYDRCQLNTFLGADEGPSSRASAVSFCNEDRCEQHLHTKIPVGTSTSRSCQLVVKGHIPCPSPGGRLHFVSIQVSNYRCT